MVTHCVIGDGKPASSSASIHHVGSGTSETQNRISSLRRVQDSEGEMQRGAALRAVHRRGDRLHFQQAPGNSGTSQLAHEDH